MVSIRMEDAAALCATTATARLHQADERKDKQVAQTLRVAQIAIARSTRVTSDLGRNLGEANGQKAHPSHTFPRSSAQAWLALSIRVTNPRVPSVALKPKGPALSGGPLAISTLSSAFALSTIPVGLLSQRKEPFSRSGVLS
jgi:hypothetical protein